MSTINETEPIELFTPDFLANPIPGYAEIRRTSPVCKVRIPSGEVVWLVTRHDDVKRGLNDPRLTNDQKKMNIARPFDAVPDDLRPELTSDMLIVDQESAQRLRRLVADAFTPRQSELLRPWLRTRCDELLDGLAKQQTFELVGEFAAPFVATGVEKILGVPSSDWHKFRELGRKLTTRFLQSRDSALIDPALRLHSYVKELVALKQAEPGDDLVTRLVRAHDNGELNRAELLSSVRLLLNAGQEGPENVISSGMLTLMCNPDQYELLREQPRLIPSAAEELIRHNPPLGLSVFRVATERLEIGGVTIPAGDTVIFSLLSAGRDESAYDKPDEIDVRKGKQSHLSFGRGAHYCVGAAMGRVLLQEAISGLVSRFEHLALTCDVAEVRWKQSVITRAPVALPVRATEVSAARGEEGPPPRNGR